MARIEPAVRVKNLTCAYGEKVIIDDVSFDVNQGEVFVILGGSGCGKSTLMKHMIGLYRPAKGSVFYNRRDLAVAEGRERDEIMRGFGVMYQSGALFGSMTVLKNVGLPLREFTDLPDKAVDAVAQMKLSLVGLGHAGDLMPSELSGGMQKRAAIARAMALDPGILYLDEPSAGLDPVTSAELDELIEQLAGGLGMTFVIVSHELPSIFAIADRVIMLDKSVKRIVAQGDPRQLRDHSDDPAVRGFFRRGEKDVEPE